MDLLLKLPRDSQFLARCKADITNACASLHQDSRFRKIIIVPNVDAY
jgi:primosomal protein N' (replication factor Y)